MKIYIANSKNESLQDCKARNYQSDETYKAFVIRKFWNGYDIKGIVLGFKFKTIEDAKSYCDSVQEQIESVSNPFNGLN